MDLVKQVVTDLDEPERWLDTRILSVCGILYLYVKNSKKLKAFLAENKYRIE
jgi:hypothetical protein